MGTAHVTLAASTSLCACRSGGVAEPRLALRIPEAPCTDRRCIASWVADAVGRAGATASDTRPTCRAGRVGLRISPAIRKHNNSPLACSQIRTIVFHGRAAYHATSQLATSQYGSDEQPSTEQVPPRQFSFPMIRSASNPASGRKFVLSLCETTNKKIDDNKQGVNPRTSLCPLCKVAFHWTERIAWISV